MHRSISLGKNKTLSANFLSYLSKTDNPEIYINDMQKYNPKYFLTFQNSTDDLDKNVSIFENCLGRVMSKKNEVGFYTGRNPFNKGNSYSGILYEIKSKHLSDCINMNLLND